MKGKKPCHLVVPLNKARFNTKEKEDIISEARVVLALKVGGLAYIHIQAKARTPSFSSLWPSLPHLGMWGKMAENPTGSDS